MKKVFAILAVLAVVALGTTSCKKNRNAPTLSAGFNWGSTIEYAGSNVDTKVVITAVSPIKGFKVVVTLPNEGYRQMAASLVSIDGNKPTAGARPQVTFDLCNDSVAASSLGTSSGAVAGKNTVNLDLATILMKVFSGSPQHADLVSVRFVVEDSDGNQAQNTVTFKYIAPPYTSPSGIDKREFASLNDIKDKDFFDVTAPAKILSLRVKVTTTLAEYNNVMRSSITISGNKSDGVIEYLKDGKAVDSLAASFAGEGDPESNIKDKTTYRLSFGQMLSVFKSSADQKGAGNYDISFTVYVTDTYGRTSTSLATFTYKKK